MRIGARGVAVRAARLPGMAASWTGSSRGPRRWVATTGLALLGSDLGLRVAGRVHTRVGPLVVAARLVPASRPGTTIDVPPLGSARLATHSGTTRLDVRLLAVDEEAARTLAGHLDTGALSDEARTVLVSAGRTLAARAAFGAAGTAAALAGLRARRTSDAAVGALVAVAVCGAQAVLAAKTLRKDSWRTPELTGLLHHIPSVIGKVETIPSQFDRYRRQLAEITSSVTGVLRGLDGLPDGPPDTAIRVVHVSDIHNNPLAFAAVRGLVRQYDAHAVLDTGDLTDWGTPAEARVFAPIGDLGVPYVYIKGNHDSAKTAELVGKFANADVCDGPAPHDVAGLRIVGVADPRFTPDKKSGGDEVSAAQMRVLGTEYAEKVRAEAAADLALVHSPEMAEALAGVVPLVLCGHTHERRERRADGTLFLTEGSSGGAGLRGVRQDPPRPLELSVLHLDRDSRRLHTIDQVRVGGLGRTEVTVVRRRAADLAPVREPA